MTADQYWYSIIIEFHRWNLIQISNFSIEKKMLLKMSFAKRGPFCFSLNVLMNLFRLWFVAHNPIEEYTIYLQAINPDVL